MKEKKVIAIGAFLFTLVLFSCEKVFDSSPYETATPKDASYQNTTQTNLNLLAKIDTTNLTEYKVALLADNHYYYGELQDAVTAINARKDIAFVLILGDLADQGLSQEYTLLHDFMNKLTKPYLTIIGNHDYLSNGEDIYQKMFGPKNYSFVFNHTKFVMFDDVFWESKETPDFGWLKNELSQNASFGNTVVCSHIPPYGDQFTPAYASLYTSILASSNTTLSAHGHLHFSYYDDERYNDSVEYVVIPYTDNRIYGELTINRSGGITSKQVSY